MKRAAIPDKRLRSLLALLLRTPEELEAERRAREPAPAPQTPGHRKGPKSALQRTLAAQRYHCIIQRKERGNHER